MDLLNSYLVYSIECQLIISWKTLIGLLLYITALIYPSFVFIHFIPLKLFLVASISSLEQNLKRLLQSKPNGIFATRLRPEYKQIFNEDLPSDVKQIIQEHFSNFIQIERWEFENYFWWREIIVTTFLHYIILYIIGETFPDFRGKFYLLLATSLLFKCFAFLTI